MKFPKPKAAILALFLAAANLGAQEYSFTPDIFAPTNDQTFGIGVGAEYAVSQDSTSREFFDFSYLSEHFGFVAAASFHQDDKYTPDEANFPDDTLFNSYFLMDQGALVVRGLDMDLRLGRMDHADVIDSPYTLFASSKRLPALLANFRYENDFAFYETRWIELNKDSSVNTPFYDLEPFPDRGAQLKTYGIKLGDMRLGFQNAAVYVGRSFDLEYFVSPVPNYLIQYVKGTTGRPWSTGINENDIMGLFWDWTVKDGLYLDAQVLIDDLNIFGIGGTPRNPWKAAYSLGARWETPVGRFGLHHALATKYSFSRTKDRVAPMYAYSYTYYPDTRFEYGDEYSAIPIEDLMIGYYNGENNIAFRLDYDTALGGFDISSNLEFVLSGPKSPTNAWHEETWYPEPGTKLLDTSPLEKKLVLTAQASRRFGDFVAFTNLVAGVAINAMELQPPFEGYDLVLDDGSKDYLNANIWIWRPGNTTVYTWSLGLGLRYEIPVMKALGGEASGN